MFLVTCRICKSLGSNIEIITGWILGNISILSVLCELSENQKQLKQLQEENKKLHSQLFVDNNEELKGYVVSEQHSLGSKLPGYVSNEYDILQTQHPEFDKHLWGRVEQVVEEDDEFNPAINPLYYGRVRQQRVAGRNLNRGNIERNPENV